MWAVEKCSQADSNNSVQYFLLPENIIMGNKSETEWGPERSCRINISELIGAQNTHHKCSNIDLSHLW